MYPDKQEEMCPIKIMSKSPLPVPISLPPLPLPISVLVVLPILLATPVLSLPAPAPVPAMRKCLSHISCLRSCVITCKSRDTRHDVGCDPCIIRWKPHLLHINVSLLTLTVSPVSVSCIRTVMPVPPSSTVPANYCVVNWFPALTYWSFRYLCVHHDYQTCDQGCACFCVGRHRICFQSHAKCPERYFIITKLPGSMVLNEYIFLVHFFMKDFCI